MLKTLAVANYRSINKLVIPRDRLNVKTGPNGSGKSRSRRRFGPHRTIFDFAHKKTPTLYQPPTLKP